MSGNYSRRAAPEPPGGDRDRVLMDQQLSGSGGAAAADNKMILPADTNINILKQKIQDLQVELQREKRDNDDARQRNAELLEQYSTVKSQNAVLVTKSTENTRKLNESENRERQLEEALIAEQKSHKNTQRMSDEWKDGFDREKNSAKERREQEKYANGGLNSSRTSPQASANAAAAASAKEVLELEDRHRIGLDNLRMEVQESMARLSEVQNDDDTAVFVARSAALSCAAELEAKLDRLEHQLATISQDVVMTIRDQEDEMGRMVIGVLEENKDLGGRLTNAQFENEKLRTELQLRARHSNAPAKEHLAQLNSSIEQLEERLRFCNETILEQTDKLAQHEGTTEKLLSDHKHLQQRFQQLEDERVLLTAQVKQQETNLADAYKHRDESEQQCQEFQRLNAHQAAQIRSISEQLKSVEETKLMEVRNLLRATQNERDDALSLSQRYKSELDDASTKASRSQNELVSRTDHFNAYKANKEEELSNATSQHQQDLAFQQEGFERTVFDLRSELKDANDELHDARRELTIITEQRAQLKAELRVQEDLCHDQTVDLENANEARSRQEERLRILQDDLDRARNEVVGNVSRQRGLDDDHARMVEENETMRENLEEERRRHVHTRESMQEQWREIDIRRTELEEELHLVKLKNCADDNLKANNQRLERDSDQLRHENARLHEQYSDVLKQMNEVQATVTRLKSRDGSNAKQQQTIDDLQRRLAELPELRHSLEESRRETYRLREETQALIGEKQELESRLAKYVDESRRNLKKDADFDRVLKDASHQLRRLDQQIDETSNTIHVKARDRESHSGSAATHNTSGGGYETRGDRQAGGRTYGGGGSQYRGNTAAGGTPHGRLNFA